mmetsp:Transcript_20198/g.43136  ORF Transcript_20198/g.43136 Transcript_20198/m.43136 type:complete len:233 (+) Transcript_20198:1209-1907(+)
MPGSGEEQVFPGHDVHRFGHSSFLPGLVDRARQAEQLGIERYPHFRAPDVYYGTRRSVNRTDTNLLGLLLLLDGPPRSVLCASRPGLLATGTIELQQRRCHVEQCGDPANCADSQAGCTSWALYEAREAAPIPAWHATAGPRPGHGQGDFKPSRDRALHARLLSHHRHGDDHTLVQHVDLPRAGLVCTIVVGDLRQAECPGPGAVQIPVGAILGILQGHELFPLRAPRAFKR